MKEIFERVSIRKYTDQPVSEENILALLRAAMAAPSAGNQQPWEFYVVTNRDKIKALSECSPYAGCLAGAPLCILPCCRTEGLRVPTLTEIDTSIATEHILLEATSLGLGAVWLAVAPVEERIANVTRALNIPVGLKPFAMVAIGHPAERRAPQDRFDLSRVHRVD